LEVIEEQRKAYEQRVNASKRGVEARKGRSLPDG
jgi:hypothetical protein